MRDVDEPTPDLLTSAEDEPAGSEWLRGALVRSGVSAWAGRHRMLLGGLAGLLVVAAAVSGYIATRPPALDADVDVGVVGFAGNGSFDPDPPIGPRPFLVTAHVAGDVIKPLGVVGPGLRHPTSTIANVRFGLPQTGNLGAKVDCSDSTWWKATDADYRARVRRTDTHGRVTTYDAPLGDSPLVDPANAFWHNQVRRNCLAAFFRTVPAATVASSAPHGHTLDVTLRLTNASQHRLWVSVPYSPGDLVEVAEGPWMPLPARGTARLKESIRVLDCSHGAPGLPVATARPGGPGKGKSLPVFLSATATPVDEQSVGVWVGLDSATVARLDRQVAAMCSPGR